MPGNSKIGSIYRIIDANINRAKEGLRVCEEICRFILNSGSLTSRLKGIRHRLEEILRKSVPSRPAIISQRDSVGDVGKDIGANELKRGNISDIFLANIQRVKESIRVLEEFTKLIDKKSAAGFKRLRYAVYELEKKAVNRIKDLSHPR